MRAPITDKHLLEMMWDRFPEIMKRGIEQPAQQEPVAWMFQHDETGRMNYVSNDGIHNPTMFLEMNPRYALVCPLYTAPPAQRKPLTPEWIWTWLMDWCKRNGSSPANYNSLFKMVADARAIEAKLKEKNNGN